jgi:adenine-specific DNA-methyltransferase
LVVANDLLTETGSVFVQIGDENVHLVRCLLDEVFGSENFVSLITVRKTGGTTGNFLAGTADYILWYGKDTERTKYRQLFTRKGGEGTDPSSYDLIELADGTRRRMTDAERATESDGLDGKRFQLTILTSPRVREARTGYFAIKLNGREYLPSTGEWKTHREGIARLIAARRIDRAGSTLRYVRYLADFPASVVTNTWIDLGGAADPIYVVQTNNEIVKRCLLMTTEPGDLVLDPTCGSGTTAFVAEQWGRRWITCDTSRVALALARTRLMSARYPYYLLADSAEGIKKEAELTGKVPPEHKTEDDIKKGFVYRRVPHVTLKSIANNPDIKEGMTRKEVDAAIARHADSETLYDQPYEDHKRVRVCGPFSVESLSPHRVLSTTEDNQGNTVSEQEAHKQQDFATMILDNLQKAGVQNTRKGERLTFDRLDAYAGAWLNAAGEYTDAGGKTRRVAVSLGPEHGTVGPQQVKEAAKEAVQGIGFDMLIVCGFAFDPHVAEEVKRYGKLTVLPAKMNPDLAMGDELLKKTGTGNLFMVFGEPDVEIKRQTNGQIVAKINGVDVYDPTTGQIRNASTDDIACWFIDTSYNGESFFVRHAYFTGAGEPYDKLQRVLRAEISEAAWSSLYSTVSRPFDKPETGKIAIKVINHYGDEVLKVFGI